MYCKKCGKKVNDEWKICPYCRTPLNKEIVKHMNRKKIESERKRNRLIGLASIVFLILVIGTFIKTMTSGENNLNKEQVLSENLATDSDGNGNISIENAKVIEDDGNDRKFIDVLVPGIYWRTSSYYDGVYGFVDISYVDGNYYLTTMLDDRDDTVGMRWYDKEILSSNLPINVEDMKSTGEAYCYDDNGNVILTLCSFQGGGRLRIDQTDVGAEFIRKSMKTYGDAYKSSFQGDMYRIITDPENPQTIDSDDIWNMMTCYLKEGEYDKEPEWTYDDNGNITGVTESQIEADCTVYSDEGKMKIDISVCDDSDYEEKTFVEGADLDTSRLYTDGEVEVLDPETGEAIAQMLTYIKSFDLCFYDSEYKGMSTTVLSNRYDFKY